MPLPAARGSPRGSRDAYAPHGRWAEAAALQAEVLLRLRAPARLAAERGTLIGLRYEAAAAEADHRRAARHLRGLAREAPDFIPAWVAAGERYAQAGRAAAARRTWVRGLRRRAAAVLLDRIEAQDAAAGQPQRTARLLRGLLPRHPAEPAVALRLARHLIARGELDEAARVLDGAPEAAAPLADGLRGELARARGDARPRPTPSRAPSDPSWASSSRGAATRAAPLRSTGPLAAPPAGAGTRFGRARRSRPAHERHATSESLMRPAN